MEKEISLRDAVRVPLLLLGDGRSLRAIWGGKERCEERGSVIISMQTRGRAFVGLLVCACLLLCACGVPLTANAMVDVQQLCGYTFALKHLDKRQVVISSPKGAVTQVRCRVCVPRSAGTGGCLCGVWVFWVLPGCWEAVCSVPFHTLFFLVSASDACTCLQPNSWICVSGEGMPIKGNQVYSPRYVCHLRHVYAVSRASPLQRGNRRCCGQYRP